MLQRFKKIIERERLKSPGKPGAILLVKRLIQVLLNKIFYLKMHVTKDGTFQSQDDVWMCSLFPQKILDVIIVDLKPRSVLDIGCGTGISLGYFLQHGIAAQGIENSAVAISQSAVKEKIIRHNLNQELNLNERFDLVWCFEVIEHIHPDFEGAFLKTLTNHSNRIILSAARPGQGGHGHFNEQEPAYWTRKFSELGYALNEAFTQKLKATGEMHAENLLCFEKK